MIQTHTLIQPIVTRTRQSGGAEREETIADLTIRPMLVGDIRAISKVKDETEQSLLLLQRLTGLDAHTVDKLGMDDFEKITKIVSDFLPAGLRAGTPPSS